MERTDKLPKIRDEEREGKVCSDNTRLSTRGSRLIKYILF